MNYQIYGMQVKLSFEPPPPPFAYNLFFIYIPVMGIDKRLFLVSMCRLLRHDIHNLKVFSMPLILVGLLNCTTNLWGKFNGNVNLCVWYLNLCCEHALSLPVYCILHTETQVCD